MPVFCVMSLDVKILSPELKEFSGVGIDRVTMEGLLYGSSKTWNNLTVLCTTLDCYLFVIFIHISGRGIMN